MTLSSLGSTSYARTAPIPNLLKSVYSTISLLGTGIYNMGFIAIYYLSSLKACSYAVSHLKGTPLRVRSLNGLASLVKFGINYP